MRKFLIHMLMLVMLTPSLACGPFLSTGKAQAAQSSMLDCAGMGMEGQNKTPSDGDHIFFKDCSKTDLFSADHAVLEKPDLGGKIFLAAWVAAIPEYGYMLTGTNAIRGPPPDWPSLSQTQPSILLTTQRFRE